MKFLSVFLVLVCASAAFANGKFSSIVGKVSYGKEGRRLKPARRGRTVKVGEVVQTQAGAYAKITMSDKNIIHVGPATKMIFTAYRSDTGTANGGTDSTLSVIYGKVRTALDSENKYDQKVDRFRVTTEAAVLGVRGTDFITEHGDESGQTRAVTIEGIVEVTGLDEQGRELEGSQMLESGQMTLVQFGQSPLEPAELSQDLFNEIVEGTEEARSSRSLKTESQDKLKVSGVFQDLSGPEELRKSRVETIPGELIDRDIGQSSVDSTVSIDINNNSGS